MKTDEFARHDGTALAELIRRKEVGASEVLDATIAAVEARNPEINAVICRLYDQARAAITARPTRWSARSRASAGRPRRTTTP